MSAAAVTATLIERFAAQTASLLERLGLGALARAAPVRTLGRWLLVRDGKRHARVIGSGLGRGLKLAVLAESPQSYWLGTHEAETQRLIGRHVHAGDVVYDCGANIGFFAALFARLVGPSGRVFAFEPSPGSLSCLETVAAVNALPHLTVVPRAVWRSSGTIHFVRNQAGASTAIDHVQGALGSGQDEGEVSEIAAIALDDFHYRDGHPAPQFIKVDVEGAESDVLQGALRLLQEYRPTVLIEVHGASGAGAWAILSDLHYDLTDVHTGARPKNVAEFAVWIRQYVAVPRPEPKT